jgi:hypothetical protein
MSESAVWNGNNEFSSRVYRTDESKKTRSLHWLRKNSSQLQQVKDSKKVEAIYK